MADKKISALTSATTPLAGTEVLPIVQSSATVKVAVQDLNPQNVKSNATSGVMQVVGPAASSTRVMTIPDANFTAARTDAGQTFSGTQVFSGTTVVGTTAAKNNAISQIRDLSILPSNNINFYRQYDVTKAVANALVENTAYTLFNVSLAAATSYNKRSGFAGQLLINVNYLDSGGGDRSWSMMYNLAINSVAGTITVQSSQAWAFSAQAGGASTPTFTLGTANATSTSIDITFKVAGGTYTVNSGTNEIVARILGASSCNDAGTAAMITILPS